MCFQFCLFKAGKWFFLVFLFLIVGFGLSELLIL